MTFLVFKDMKLAPVHSRPQRIRSDRCLPQRGGLLPFWKLMRRRPRRQRGGWLSQSVVRIPGMDLAQRLARRRRYKTHHDVVLLHLDEEEGDVKEKKWQKQLQLTLVPKDPSTQH